jgi:hypothetical protein
MINIELSLCLTNEALRHEGVWGDWMYRSTFSSPRQSPLPGKEPHIVIG